METEHGIFVIGTKDNLIQKLHYNTLLNSLLSKVVANENEIFKNEKKLVKNEIYSFGD